MILDEFLVLLGLKADTDEAKEFGAALDKVEHSAENVDNAMVGAFKSTESFVNAVGAVMGVVGFFTGILGGMTAVLHGTIMELDDLIEGEKLLHKVTKDQLDQQKKYKESVETMGKRWQSLKVELAFGFLPTMQKMVDAFDGFLAKNQELIVNGIMKFLNVMTSVFGVLANFVRFIDKVITSTVGWEKALYILGAALLWLNRRMLLAFITNPIFWVIAAIGVLLLLIDDFMTYLDGGESQFGAFWGSMLDWIKENQDWLNSLKQVFVSVGETVGAVMAIIVGIFTGNTELIKTAWAGMIDSLIAFFTNFAMLFEPLAQVLVSTMERVWDAIVSAVQARIELMKSAIQSGIDSIAGILSNVFEIVTSPFRMAFDWISEKFSGIGNLISGAINGVRSLGSAASATTNNSSSSVVNMNMNTNITASNPNQAAKAFQTAGTNMLNTAQRNQGSKVAV